MSRIETEIWEPHPDKKGMLQYVGQRKTEDVFRELETFLQEENIYPDEYLSMDIHFSDRYPLFPQMRDIICYAQWGGSEGIYLEVDLLIRDAANNKNESVHFVTGKTLEESQEAYDRMQYIAGCIYKAFTEEGFVSSRYVILKSKAEKKGVTHETLTAKLEQECKDMLRDRLLHKRESLSEIAGELRQRLQILDEFRGSHVFESFPRENKKRTHENDKLCWEEENLKFNGIEHCDNFDEEHIFWVELSSVPTYIQKLASAIDGKDYNPTAFGACVLHDLETDQMYFVEDHDLEGDVFRNIFYIDNNGDKHSFSVEISNTLKNHIFNACRDMSKLEAEDKMTLHAYKEEKQ